MSWIESSKIQHPDDVRKVLGFRGDPDELDLLKLYKQAKQAGIYKKKKDHSISISFRSAVGNGVS